MRSYYSSTAQVEIFYKMRETCLMRSDFTTVKCHLISKKCHFSVVKCHSTDEASMFHDFLCKISTGAVEILQHIVAAERPSGRFQRHSTKHFTCQRCQWFLPFTYARVVSPLQLPPRGSERCNPLISNTFRNQDFAITTLIVGWMETIFNLCRSVFPHLRGKTMP